MWVWVGVFVGRGVWWRAGVGVGGGVEVCVGRCLCFCCGLGWLQKLWTGWPDSEGLVHEMTRQNSYLLGQMFEYWHLSRTDPSKWYLCELLVWYLCELLVWYLWRPLMWYMWKPELCRRECVHEVKGVGVEKGG